MLIMSYNVRTPIEATHGEAVREVWTFHAKLVQPNLTYVRMNKVYSMAERPVGDAGCACVTKEPID